ncbi:MAG: hypothetical protein IPL40_15675 [Proteobacteria bacterium]|nr:hypothetical protein [Pseudomonadota bacterium]
MSAAYRAPECLVVGVSCDTAGLVDGRATLGPERDAPNTLASSCLDGLHGRYHADESIDGIRVSTADGGMLGIGKTVHIDVALWAWVGYATDALDLYTTTFPGGVPTWTLRATLKPTKAGPQTLRYSYVLPAAATQAVRAQFRYRGSASSPCSSGPYNDRDDLVFSVGAADLP